MITNLLFTVIVVAIVFAMAVFVIKEALMTRRRNEEMAHHIRKTGENLGLDLVGIDRLHRRLEKSLERKRKGELENARLTFSTKRFK